MSNNPNLADLPEDVQARITAGIADYHRLRADNDKLREELSLAKRDHEYSRLECDALKRQLEDSHAARLREVEEAKRDVAGIQGKLDATGTALSHLQALFRIIRKGMDDFEADGGSDGGELPKIPLRGGREIIERVGPQAVEAALQPERRSTPGYRPTPHATPRRQ